MAALFNKSKNQRDAFSPARQAGDTKPLVLVVEDHEDTYFLLNYLLEQRGCRVMEAKDGEDAVRLAIAARPDLVLMDISLPHQDGLAAAWRMRQTDALREVPIVFLSGHAEASFRAEALAQGGDDYLVKPFTLDEIERMIERYLGGRAAKVSSIERDLS
ncbi:MAG TPA: response regulator [Pyrinomonadaceae bacterium]|nr:response regulator [Pyrinomonadaceae bacterium]